MDFTVVIPTFNGSSKLPAVFDRLRKQASTDNISWEIIVVDNNSNDGTKELISEYQLKWPKEIPLIYQFEPRRGIIFARQSGAERASGNMLGFLDDDNLPSDSWIRESYAFGKEHPRAGAFNGKVLPLNEFAFLKEHRKLWHILALIDWGENTIELTGNNRNLLVGAGLVVRKEAWLSVPIDKIRSAGRSGGSLVGGDEFETELCLQKSGWKLLYNPRQVIFHDIKEERLTKDYLLRLSRAGGYGRYVFRSIRLGGWKQIPGLAALFVRDFVLLLSHVFNRRWAIKNDIEAGCQFQFLYGTLVSPFYYLLNSLKNVFQKRS